MITIPTTKHTICLPLLHSAMAWSVSYHEWFGWQLDFLKKTQHAFPYWTAWNGLPRRTRNMSHLTTLDDGLTFTEQKLFLSYFGWCPDLQHAHCITRCSELLQWNSTSLLSVAGMMGSLHLRVYTPSLITSHDYKGHTACLPFVSCWQLHLSQNKHTLPWLFGLWPDFSLLHCLIAWHITMGNTTCFP